MEQFMEFVDRQQRETRRHLQLIEQLLKSKGFQAQAHLDEDDPYVFVKSPNAKLSFDGIRIDEVGDLVAYRIQKEEKTHPYGKAYMLNLEDMFNDFMSENMEEEEAGRQVIEGVAKELKKFFEKSAAAEQEIRDLGWEDRGIILKTGGTDYSSLALSKL